jgi:hypothetical protein
MHGVLLAYQLMNVTTLTYIKLTRVVEARLAVVEQAGGKAYRPHKTSRSRCHSELQVSQ